MDMQNYAKAPKVKPEQLWGLSPDEFNDWRKKHDFPRIITYCQSKLNQFRIWQKEYEITYDDLLNFGPGIFLRPDKKWFIAKHKNSNGELRHHFHQVEPKINGTWCGEKIISIYKTFIPYLSWAEINSIQIHKKQRMNDIQVTSKTGSLQPPFKNDAISAEIFGELELLFLGNCKIEGVFLGGRMLEFTCLDGLRIIDCTNNQVLRVWFSSAEYISVRSHLAFVSFFCTQVNHISITNSTLQNWEFEKSTLFWGEIFDSTLFKWEVKSIFTPSLNNVRLDECDFDFSIESYHSLEQVRDNYALIKRAYSSMGRYYEAGKYYYLQKNIRLRQLCNPLSYGKQIPGDGVKSILTNYKKGIWNSKESLHRFFYTFSNHIKFIINPMNWIKISFNIFRLFLATVEFIFWGYGEKPLRIIFSSLIVNIGFSLFYYCANGSNTYHNMIQSIYLSASAFLSFGFSELINSNLYFPIVLESFIGVLCTGFLIAALVNKRRY